MPENPDARSAEAKDITAAVSTAVEAACRGAKDLDRTIVVVVVPVIISGQVRIERESE